MALIVQKYGGTSVGSVDRIKNVANRIIKNVNEGNRVVVVVSAMGKTTDDLVQLASEITDNPSKREMDMLLTTGEQISVSLLSIALHQKGYEAVSLTGWQAGIKTESLHGNARILNIETSRLNYELNKERIVIVAGFQGVSESSEITTLGRGGSDTSAVALAAALKAKKCSIYTDVTGVFTTDPRMVSQARKLASISYDEMLEMANLGAGVLHPRAVEFAKNHNVVLEVCSSLVEEPGTVVEEEPSMETNLIVRGIAFESNVTKVTLAGLPNEMNTLANVFTTLAQNGINVDIIIQNANGVTTTNISFSIETSSLNETITVLENNRSTIKYTDISSEGNLSKVSIIGSGMISNPGVAAKMFKALADKGIMIKMVSTSEIKVSTVIPQEHMVTAVETLHDVFELSKIEVNSTTV